MQIEFLQSVAHARGGFRQGDLVTVPKLPKGWQAWLEAGLIRIKPSDVMESAVVDSTDECAVVPRRSRRRRAAVAE